MEPVAETVLSAAISDRLLIARLGRQSPLLGCISFSLSEATSSATMKRKGRVAVMWGRTRMVACQIERKWMRSRALTFNGAQRRCIAWRA